MQILVISDEHGDFRALQQVLQIENCRHVFCLGDGVRDYEDAQDLYPNRIFHIVSGNCDWYSSSQFPAVNLETLEGKRILYMHGHLQDVKHTMAGAYRLAVQDEADVLLFGHTHCPFEEETEGILFCNPGSLADGNYGLLTIQDDEIVWNAKVLER